DRALPHRPSPSPPLATPPEHDKRTLAPIVGPRRPPAGSPTRASRSSRSTTRTTSARASRSLSVRKVRVRLHTEEHAPPAAVLDPEGVEHVAVRRLPSVLLSFYHSS